MQLKTFATSARVYRATARLSALSQVSFLLYILLFHRYSARPRPCQSNLLSKPFIYALESKAAHEGEEAVHRGHFIRGEGVGTQFCILLKLKRRFSSFSPHPLQQKCIPEHQNVQKVYTNIFHNL